MLGARVATAIVLLAILLPTIFVFPPLAWGTVTLAFLAVAAWEWTRLLPGARPARTAAALLLAAGAGAIAWRASHPWPPGLLLALNAGLALFWALDGPRRLKTHAAHGGGWALAALLLFGCWLSLYELRLLGTVPLLSSMAIVWVADIAAYFAGRAFGRHKLAPSISPGKTWEGAAGGAAAVVLAGLVLAGWPAASESLPALLVTRASAPLAAAALLVIVALSIVGDLHESVLKRLAGVKDSGKLLPGHGGVLDRIDALIPTMPVALGLYQLLR